MNKQNTPKDKKQRRNIWPKAVMAIVIVALLAVIAYLAMELVKSKEHTQPVIEDDVVQVLELDPNAGELVTPTPAPQEPGVAIPGWGSMIIPAGVQEVRTAMKNPEANEGWYYLTFELRLKETDEVLFTTGLIPPGQYCNKVTLSRPLEPGEYAAVVHVQPYRISDKSPTNNADMETVLIVQ